MVPQSFLRCTALAALLLVSPARLTAQDNESLAKAAAAKATERRADLQKILAVGSDVLIHLRLDSFAAVGPRIKITGVFLEPAVDPEEKSPKPAFEALQDELRDLVKDAVKDVTKGKQILFDFSGITRLECDDSLFARLQKAVAARPSLDGVRVDAGARFGANGEFLPAGLRPKLDAKDRAALEKAFGECCRDVLADLSGKGDAAAERYKKLAAGPAASAAGMIEVDTRKILAELREWAKSTRDDVRFTRLYFGPDGGLKLVCEAPTDKDVQEVRGKLKELVPSYFPSKPASGSDSPPKEEQKPPLVESSTIPAFTPFLQKQLADDAKKRWAAVLIERGYFDETNRYTLRGVIDQPAQKAELAQFVAAFADDPKWKAYFTADTKRERVSLALDAIPMSELVARVQRVAPAYRVFDGIGIAGAKYDTDANLIFTAHTVGKPKLNDARLTLAALMAKHPDYSRRLAKTSNDREPKLRIESLPDESPPANDELPEFSLAFIAAALAKEDMPKAKKWIDIGILHFPHESAIWFLSAYYNHLRGDKELVRRDLFRLIETEGLLESPQRKRRFEVAKNLQGQKRDEIEKLWLECWKEAQEGVKPITLVPAK